jgi:Leucine-rich repeat (LRR) protein
MFDQTFFHQAWLITQIDERPGVYKLCNLTSGTYLDLSSGSSDDGAQIQGWHAVEQLNAFNQMWIIKQSELVGYYQLVGNFSS